MMHLRVIKGSVVYWFEWEIICVVEVSMFIVLCCQVLIVCNVWKYACLSLSFGQDCETCFISPENLLRKCWGDVSCFVDMLIRTSLLLNAVIYHISLYTEYSSC